jgi:hypothetical protein
MSRFTQRYLDPASRLGEVLFGLIMVLTITLTAGLTVSEGRTGVRQLLAAAIGCNVAWGVIDAAMYLMNCVTVRTSKMRLVKAVQDAPDDAAALSLIQDEVDPELQELLEPGDSESFGQSILKHVARARGAGPVLTKDDFYGALACFWLVFVSCLPAAFPFLIFDRPRFALRVSNLLLLMGLFYVGYKWARYTGTNRWILGFSMVAVGLVLVSVAILLGG